MNWCTDNHIDPTVEAITRKIAARFITECLLPRGSNPATCNKHISRLSSYWKWQEKRGDAEDNPWARQRVPKARPHRAYQSEKKRPFTDDEVFTLLSGNAGPMLADLMRIAALTGMRIEEICGLRVRDCADGCFDIVRAKTAAGQRRVPIHSQLMSIVAARCQGKVPTAFIFHELPPPAPSRKDDDRVSPPASKAFTRYRRSVGVDERSEGARQSNIDFHSFRRWFITKAHRALQDGATGFTPWTCPTSAPIGQNA